MATTTNFSVRMDSDIKKQCEALYGELGVNLTTAINVFLRQSLRVGGFPFDVRVEQPNKETIAAMLEAERIVRDPSFERVLIAISPPTTERYTDEGLAIAT